MAEHFGRFGFFPEWYPTWARKHCGGVPERVFEMANDHRASQCWVVPEYEINPHPGLTRIHYGPRSNRQSFLVPTRELVR